MVVEGLVATAIWFTLMVVLWPRLSRRLRSHDHQVAAMALLVVIVPVVGWAGLLRANASPWTPASAAPTEAVCERMRAQAPPGAVYYLNDPCIWVAWDHRDEAAGVYIQTSQGWVACEQLAEDVALGILEPPTTQPCQLPPPASLGSAGPQSQLLPTARGTP